MASAITLTGKRPKGKWELLFEERMARDRARAKERGFVFDQGEAREAINFFSKYCRHHKGEWAGKPLVLADWQSTNIGEIFGWRHQETALRRFRQAWWETPRKNGKTQVAGGVGLRLLVADGEEGGEVYFTATKRDQAKIGYVAACQMVKRSPGLRKYLNVPKGFLRGATLVCDRLGAKMEPLSADHSTLDGLNPSGDIRDEVHEWKDHGLAAVLDSAMGARRQPLTFEITTAGVYDQTGVGWTRHDYACNVLEGTFDDDAQFAFIAAADEGDDPFDPMTWWKANPNLGVSPKIDYIAGRAEKARRMPTYLNDFLRYHLNVWTQQVTRWLPMDRWNESDPRNLSFEGYEDWAKSLFGRECYGGLDLASTLDLTAFVLAFPWPDGSVDLLCRFWIPEKTVERYVHEGKRHYQNWVDLGWLTTTPGDEIDYKWIRQEIGKLGEKYEIKEISFDRWGATQLVQGLGEEDGFTMVKCGQGYQSLSAPTKDLEAAVTSRRVRHGGHPILRWNAGNAVVRRDPAGNIKPDKEKAKDKIDGIVAAIMSMSTGLMKPETGGSYLEDGGGLLVL
jgi:phage terminase large subunit-like protein